MKNKLFVLLKIVIILVLATYYLITIVIPEYKEKLGSSDKFISAKLYNNMFEVDVDNKVNFAFVIDKDGYVYHIFFFNNNSLCLYNKDIEGLSISDATESMIKILIENNYLSNLSNINITNYNGNYFDDFKSEMLFSLIKYNIDVSIVENSSTLYEKAKSLKLNNNDNILYNIDLYSKTIIYKYLDDYKKNSIDNLSDIKDYTDIIYEKLNKYVNDNGITNLEKDDDRITITLIPIDADNNIYPTNNSWYYVKESKVYAYIEFSNNNGYCYRGSIDNYKKGEC